MRTPFAFFIELFDQPKAVIVWVGYLMMINMASLLFWNNELSKIIFFTFLISSMFMMLLYSTFGFKKILGLGHILWIPLIIYIGFNLHLENGSFYFYLIVFIISISISLFFDILDVYKYCKFG